MVTEFGTTVYRFVAYSVESLVRIDSWQKFGW